ncbi:hypothetical protein, partial [Enterococcus casseliflavus]|uniref:hypothetical protein n=1 Tax=Enterococcus casseliflavus TaxID=37734 RepID=UPI003D0FDF62
TDVSKNEGFPKGILGIIGVGVSGSDPKIVSVLKVEFHHSKDGGKTFEMVPKPHSPRPEFRTRRQLPRAVDDEPLPVAHRAPAVARSRDTCKQSART